MSFMESYKRLEKLCGDLISEEKPVQAYIDKMYNTPRGWDLIRGWDDDLKHLKRCKRLRNLIAHEPDCTEENTVRQQDIEWLENFYNRLLNGTDPLSLYKKATAPKRIARTQYDERKQLSETDNSGVVVAVLMVIIIAIFLMCVYAAYAN